MGKGNVPEVERERSKPEDHGPRHIRATEF